MSQRFVSELDGSGVLTAVGREHDANRVELGSLESRAQARQDVIRERLSAVEVTGQVLALHVEQVERHKKGILQVASGAWQQRNAAAQIAQPLLVGGSEPSAASSLEIQPGEVEPLVAIVDQLGCAIELIRGIEGPRVAALTPLILSRLGAQGSAEPQVNAGTLLHRNALVGGLLHPVVAKPITVVLLGVFSLRDVQQADRVVRVEGDHQAFADGWRQTRSHFWNRHAHRPCEAVEVEAVA